MPGYILHLLEAKITSSYLKKHIEDRGAIDYPQWEHLFLCGALLPDAIQKSRKHLTHYWDTKSLDQIFQLPNLELFLEQHSLSLSNPILCGYYTHLHLDRAFFETYIPSRIELRNAIGQCDGTRAGAVSVWLKESGQLISLADFFSENYLYGDYTKLNKLCLERYKLSMPRCEDFPSRISWSPVGKADLERLLDELEDYLKIEQSKEAAPRVLSFSSLISFLEDVAYQSADILSNYKEG